MVKGGALYSVGQYSLDDKLGDLQMLHTFEVCQSFRRDGILCDVKLESEDGTIVDGHKVVLASTSPYFYAQFTKCQERKKDHVVIKELNFSTLKILVEFLYTTQILITENNIQVLLHAANLLQIQNVKESCCKFLLTQLHPSNCLRIKAFADLYNCMELSSSSESYIRRHFSEVVESDEFLSLSFEQVIKLISNNELTVASEDKVFESVISWVDYNSICRKDSFPKLMEHVRLPLVSKNKFIKTVEEQVCLINSPECKDYLLNWLCTHLLKYVKPTNIPKTKRANLLKFLQRWNVPKTIQITPMIPIRSSKIILVAGEILPDTTRNIQWYDPAIDRWQIIPFEINKSHFEARFVVLNDQRVFALGGCNGIDVLSTVDVLDFSLSSPYWSPSVPMSTCRCDLGVAVIENCIYAIGGMDWNRPLRSAEVFDLKTQTWNSISNMATKRVAFGVGVINNILYAVGGFGSNFSNSTMVNHKSVECYNPSTDTWSPVADMLVSRSGLNVGVIDGVLYAVGGHNGQEYLNSVEAYNPSTDEWTYVANMNIRRRNAGVVVLNGLLYAVGGYDGVNKLDSIEVYNPVTDIWSMLTVPMNINGSSGHIEAGVVVINRPLSFNTSF